MAKQNNQQSLIDTSSSSLVCTEQAIQISDEKLKSVLCKTYETARTDANKFKIYKHFGIFLSIGFTLLITLLTSEFGALGTISGSTLRIICIVVCIISFIIGVAFIILFAIFKGSNVFIDRDKAINEIMKNLK